MSYHGGSSEDLEGSARPSRCRRMETGSRAYSTSTIHLTVPSSLRAQQPARPKGIASDENVFDLLQDAESSPGGLRAPRPNSLESSRNASTSSSPLTPRGSSSFPPVRSESISSEDLVPTRDAATFPRDNSAGRSATTMMASGGKTEPLSNRNSLIAYSQAEKRPPGRGRPRPRSGSPGSEMVTLEEFLEESNLQSPSAEASSGRDDPLGEYFRRSVDPPEIGKLAPTGYRDCQTMPTNFVSPSMGGDGRTVKPGQFVKPSLRPMEAAAGSLRRGSPTQQPKQTPEPQHPGARGNALSRTFSLATADLLKANGSDVSRMDKPETETSPGKDFNGQVLRTSTPTGSPRDRPQSARMTNLPRGDDFRCRSLDTRHLSLANPSPDRTLQSSQSSGNLQQAYTALPAGRGRPRPIARYGEVAMISPVRPIASIPEAEGQTPKQPSTSPDCPPPPATEDDTNKAGSTKSTPASPDPNADPQTVWYEYGCV